jgi:hypothetical protein
VTFDLRTSVAALLLFVVAGGLHAAETDPAPDRALWGVEKPKPGPVRPLEQFVGNWQRRGVPEFGSEWAERISVRTDGQRAWLRISHRCPPRYCDQGEFEATVYGSAGAVYALEVIRMRGPEVMWTVTLRPDGRTLGYLILEEDRRAKDPQKNPLDNQSSTTGLRRIR